MKRPALWFAAILLLSLQHCENSDPVQLKSTPHNQILKEVREWYGTGLPSGVSNKSLDLKLKFIEFWESAKVLPLGKERYVVTVPLARQNDTGISKYQLMAFRDKESTKGFIVQVTPEKGNIGKNEFSGQVKLRSRKGNQLKAFKFRNGKKLINSTSTLRAMNDEVAWTGELPEVEIVAMSYDDNFDAFFLWMDLNGSGWDMSDFNDWVDENNAFDGGWIFEDYNFDGYTDVGFPVIEPPTIIINLSDPCLDNVAVNLNNADIPNDINQAINEIFASNNMTNLVLEQNNTQNVPARTTVTSSSNPFVVTITFNPSYYTNTSAEYVAATMYHEAMHAYIDATGGAGLSQLEQHVEIASEYIGWLVDALQDVYPELPDKDAKGLALRGLNDVMEGNPAYWDNLVQSLGFEDTEEVITLTDAYRDGTAASGHPCPNN